MCCVSLNIGKIIELGLNGWKIDTEGLRLKYMKIFLVIETSQFQSNILNFDS